MVEGECEESLKTHTCQGPLHKIKEGDVIRIICMGAIKRLIIEGHDIVIEENIPRKLKKVKWSPFNNYD